MPWCALDASPYAQLKAELKAPSAMLVFCQNAAMERALNVIFDWFEREPRLYVAVLGSTQKKAWCAGQDLKEMVRRNTSLPSLPAGRRH